MRNKEVQDFAQSGGGKATLFAILGPSIVRIKQNRASIRYSRIIAVMIQKWPWVTEEEAIARQRLFQEN
jgi:hypothetical protein